MVEDGVGQVRSGAAHLETIAGTWDFNQVSGMRWEGWRARIALAVVWRTDRRRVGFRPQLQCVCVGGRMGVPTSPSHSLASAECLTIQLSSDVTYLGTVSDSTGLGFSPTRLFLHPPPPPLLTHPLGYRSEFPTMPSLGLINFLELLTELRETVYLPDY